MKYIWYHIGSITLLCCGICLANTAGLPEGMDWAATPSLFEALQRLSAKSGIGLPRQAWPLSTNEIRSFLNQVQRLTSYTGYDSVVLRDFLAEPSELRRWSRIDDGTFLVIEPYIKGEFRRESRTNFQKGSIGAKSYGTLGGQLQYFSDANISTEWADDYVFFDRYTIGDGEPSGVPFGDENRNDLYKKRTFARYTAYIQGQKNWLTLKFGRDYIQHGPGEWTGLSTSRHIPPWLMLDTRAAPFEWLSIQASILEANPTDYYAGPRDPNYYVGDTRKWLHVHRFELRPFQGFEFAFQNMVIYPADSGGGINPGYLLPLVPIFFSQDLNGNRDNSAIQFDLRVDKIANTSIWAALMIDDLNGPTALFDENWLNRWAALAGFRLISPFRKFDADIVAEITMVRPWTYTGGREASYSFSHYGFPTGSEGGPDSRSFHVSLTWRPTSIMDVSSEFCIEDKGRGRQAKLGTVHSPADPESVSMLDNVHRTMKKNWTLGVEPWLGRRLSGTVGYTWSDSAKLRGVQWSGSISTAW